MEPADMERAPAAKLLAERVQALEWPVMEKKSLQRKRRFGMSIKRLESKEWKTAETYLMERKISS